MGSIYRHPNQSVDSFRESLDDILVKIATQGLPCIIAGDINIDLTKCAVDVKTAEYVDMLLTNNFIPLPVMPTRITSQTASLIDHMCFFEGQGKTGCTNLKSGNFLEDISDHSPSYTVILNEKGHRDNQRPLIRIFSEKNIDENVHVLQIADWSAAYNETDANAAYNKFSEVTHSACNQAFHQVRLSRKRLRDKKMDNQCPEKR
jgi:hypothetical protein